MTAAFALPFQAPPVREPTKEEAVAAFDAEVAAMEAHAEDHTEGRDPESRAPLQMSKGARATATADGISEDKIRAAIADPDEIEPDPAGNGRMRLRRGTLQVVLARDGAVLSVRDRRSRMRATGSRPTGSVARR